MKNKDNKTGTYGRQYFKYAMGEIVLVVIGILIALQINNWNENRLHNNELENILKMVRFDLTRDTVVANNIIEFYALNAKNSLKIINQEINRDNYDDCVKCLGLISVYRPFSIQTKGYDLLKNYSSQNIIQTDTLIVRITQFYTPFIEIIDDSNEFIKNEVLSNVQSFKAKPWFVDWTQGKFNEEMIIYFTESEDYRKRVASHNLLAGKNHLLFVSTYKDNAAKVLELLNTRFKD